MSQPDERILAFAARVLDAQQAPPLVRATDDTLNVPYPGTRWQLGPDGGLRKVPRRRAKADAIGTRSDLRRYFIQVLQHRRELEHLLGRGEGLQRRADVMMQLRLCTDELFVVGQRLLATAPRVTTEEPPASTPEAVPCEGNDHGV